MELHEVFGVIDELVIHTILANRRGTDHLGAGGFARNRPLRRAREAQVRRISWVSGTGRSERGRWSGLL